jgi:hypothetical protein
MAIDADLDWGEPQVDQQRRRAQLPCFQMRVTRRNMTPELHTPDHPREILRWGAREPPDEVVIIGRATRTTGPQERRHNVRVAGISTSPPHANTRFPIDVTGQLFLRERPKTTRRWPVRLSWRSPAPSAPFASNHGARFVGGAEPSLVHLHLGHAHARGARCRRPVGLVPSRCEAARDI